MSQSTVKRFLIERSILVIVMSILVIFTLMLTNVVHEIQGSGRVINYTGIVRGATQRLVKLEIANQYNDNAISYIDDILDGLGNGSTQFDLVELNSYEYKNNLMELSNDWDKMKEIIYLSRDIGYENTNLLDMSEEFFLQADKTVSSAEFYSESLVLKLYNLEYILLTIVICIVIYIISQTLHTLKIVKRNNTLKEKAYLDIHTQLPNKSKCNELINNNLNISNDTTVVMFDLNNLKKVNDTLGHIAGDSLIKNFATILRTNIPSKYFVGRFGGDEFLCILYTCNKNEIKSILDSILESTKNYNELGQQAPLSYSYGYARSSEYEACTLQVLLDKADKNMYEDKKENKIKLNKSNQITTK